MHPPPPGAWQRLCKNPVAVVTMTVLAVVFAFAFLGPFVFHADPHATSSAQFAAPSAAHPFGTDNNGRDVLARVMEGARISLLVGLCGALISLLIGTSYGLVSGYAAATPSSWATRKSSSSSSPSAASNG